MFIESVSEQLDRIEARTNEATSADELIAQLRVLGLDDFGLFLISLPNERFPRISSKLPRMASDEIQRQWTGGSGSTLLRLSCAFMRSVAYNFSRHTGRPLDGRRILDFGCGYGRLSRLAYFFSDRGDVFGVDPWDRSIEICIGDGMGSNFLVSDYLPTTLPVPGQFDLIFAFSVFTHTSERATKACLSLLADRLAPSGLLAITIRPIEYWQQNADAAAEGKVDDMIRAHIETGFAYFPHKRVVIDDEFVYGDTSITTEWIQQNFPQLRICGIDRSLDDPLQRYVFMKRQ